MQCELKNVKVHRDMSEETECFSATLYCDGIKTADVRNEGQGGPNRYHALNLPKYTEFTAMCAAKPPMPNEYFPDRPLPWDEDMEISELLQAQAEEKQLRRNCKTKLCYILTTDKPGAFWTVNKPYTPVRAAALRLKYVAELKEIINERYLGTPVENARRTAPQPAAARRTQ